MEERISFFEKELNLNPFSWKRKKEMTSEVITLVQELGFPIALSVGLAFALYSVVRFILKRKSRRYSQKI